ncbi:outer membrane protein assembly factor BamE [Guyparkeria hydrothermalis]|uniref:outer membrane protein assembly factor BamE n=1 Tax=Guyparkeria hydrothermalis TaxID=923 RepID=UPI0020202AB0|nr:outer membrane protein assembly factor BamE [Guyparkeria hydrothermalis]MCL7743402.1 outer membrane protein assembly factor BamE [Guyparkeria hydrothermalis]
MTDGRTERKAGNAKPVSTPSRPEITHGMTKDQVRSALGAPDFKSPTMWGYHDKPPMTVTFDINGMVTSAISAP